jgi:hypothetical protein
MQDRIECHYWLLPDYVFNISARLHVFQSLPVNLFAWIKCGTAPDIGKELHTFYIYIIYIYLTMLVDCT